MYLWLALPLGVSIAISLLTQMESKRREREPLPAGLGEWRPAPSLGEGWEERELVLSAGLLGDKLVHQTRRKLPGGVVEVGPERTLRRV